jgi:PadR family transcriptional regulator, regulatory protein PadR
MQPVYWRSARSNFRGDSCSVRRWTYTDGRYIVGHMNKRRAMQEASFLILTALAGGSQHGYGIVTDVAQISGGRVELKAGTLYAALERLTADGLIEPDREEIVDSRLRRYYRITRDGAERLAEEADRLRANAHAALTRLRPGVAIS